MNSTKNLKADINTALFGSIYCIKVQLSKNIQEIKFNQKT